MIALKKALNLKLIREFHSCDVIADDNLQSCWRNT